MTEGKPVPEYTKIPEEKRKFWTDGFVIIRNAFMKYEMEVQREVINRNAMLQMQHQQLKIHNIQQAFATINVWNDTSGNDLFSMVTRSTKIMDRLAYFFDDDVYDYHNKIPLKYPGIVGFPFHQDYAYWYTMGNLYPDMAAVFVAIDDANEANGCLRIVKGSHRLGRMEHCGVQGFDGVEPERLKIVLNKLEQIPIILNSGDMVLFHGNAIHGSAPNSSSNSRLALIGTYNTRHNSPYKMEQGHPRYEYQTRIYREIHANDAVRMPDFKLVHAD